METTGTGRYPLHLVRWLLRAIASIFLLISFSLYVADGAACVSDIKLFNDDPYYYGYEDPFKACWQDALYGDLRPVLCVRTPISFAHG